MLQLHVKQEVLVPNSIHILPETPRSRNRMIRFHRFVEMASVRFALFLQRADTFPDVLSGESERADVVLRRKPGIEIPGSDRFLNLPERICRVVIPLIERQLCYQK